MPSKKRAGDLMSRPVKTLGRNDKLSVADTLMRTDRIRYLPVVDDDGRVVGNVSQRDREDRVVARRRLARYRGGQKEVP